MIVARDLYGEHPDDLPALKQRRVLEYVALEMVLEEIREEQRAREAARGAA